MTYDPDDYIDLTPRQALKIDYRRNTFTAEIMVRGVGQWSVGVLHTDRAKAEADAKIALDGFLGAVRKAVLDYVQANGFKEAKP